MNPETITDPIDPTMWSGLLHGGLSGSFLSLPHVPPNAEAIRAHGAQAAIYGLPFDATNISRTGANYGPRSIRDVSRMCLTYNATLDLDVLDLNPVDTGDCALALANPEKTFARAQADISEIIAGGALPVTLGGDHSITIPAARAVQEHVSDAGFVLIDTHLDTAADVGGEELNHCCPIPRAIEAGFDPTKVVLVGISGWMNPRTELAYCREHGVAVIWLEEIWEKGTKWAVERALEVAGSGSDGIYMSFDVDALDGAYAPGTCCPTPAGMTSREAIELVRGICSNGLVGFDVVETAPSLEGNVSSTTALLAARVTLEAMAFHAQAGSAA
ncbi:MAG TPA: agmatinase [Solirubrobacterales bacterium]|jgi:agmatinase